MKPFALAWAFLPVTPKSLMARVGVDQLWTELHLQVKQLGYRPDARLPLFTGLVRPERGPGVREAGALAGRRGALLMRRGSCSGRVGGFAELR